MSTGRPLRLSWLWRFFRVVCLASMTIAKKIVSMNIVAIKILSGLDEPLAVSADRISTSDTSVLRRYSKDVLELSLRWMRAFDASEFIPASILCERSSPGASLPPTDRGRGVRFRKSGSAAETTGAEEER
jgi:hypothetical protein